MNHWDFILNRKTKYKIKGNAFPFRNLKRAKRLSFFIRCKLIAYFNITTSSIHLPSLQGVPTPGGTVWQSNLPRPERRETALPDR